MNQARSDNDAFDDDALATFSTDREDARARPAYEALFRRHEQTLRQCAARFAGRNHTVADDAFAETMAEVWAHRLEYRPERGSWLSWAITRLRSRVADQFRRRLRYQQEAEEQGPSSFRDPKALPPEQLVADRDEFDRALAGLAAVNPRAREALLLRYGENYEVEEIAARLGVKAPVVYSLLRTGAEFLEGALGCRGDFQP